MLNCKKSTIAIFDSGIGGLSVLKQLITKHKTGNYIYFVDNLHMPYGNKNQKWLKKRVNEIICKLKQVYKADEIIIACNTASTCIDDKQKNIHKMKFDLNKTYYATYLTKTNLPEHNIIADKTLAKKIENNILNTDKLRKIISHHVKQHKLYMFKELVLGCTHYELVKNMFEEICPKTTILNNSNYLIEHLTPTTHNELNIVVIMSKKSKELEDKIKKVLELN